MLSLEADVDIPDVPFHGHPVGIDVGLEYFLSTSDGEQVKRPRFFDELHRKLKSLQRRLKTKRKGSNDSLKLQKKISRVHQRIADTRKDWHYKLAHHLCDGAGAVFVEDLDFRIMAKGMLGKHILDAGLGQFTNQVLPWVCWKRDVYYGKVDPRGTSQECPDCGADGAQRSEHSNIALPLLRFSQPRDVAAAQMISTRGQRGIETACGVEAAGAGVTQSSWLAAKRELFGVTQGISLHTR